MKAKKLSRRSSKRYFRKGVKRIHKKNLRKVLSRGGFSL